MRQDRIGKKGDETWDYVGQWPNCCSGGPDWSVTSLCLVLHGSLKCYVALLSVTWFTEVLRCSAECYKVHWSVASLCWGLHGLLKCYIALLSVTWFTEVLHCSAKCYMVHWSKAGLQWSGTWFYWSVTTLLKCCRTPVKWYVISLKRDHFTEVM